MTAGAKASATNEVSAGGAGGFEIWRKESGAQVEAGEVYSREIGFAEDGGSDIGAAEIRALHFGVAEIGGAQIGVAQNGVGKVGAKTFDAAELHAGHVGAGEDCFGEVGAAEVSIFEIGTGEVGVAEARVGEISFFQIGAAKEGEREIGSAEIGAREIGVGKVGAFASGIAFDEFGVGFENFGELFGFHGHSLCVNGGATNITRFQVFMREWTETVLQRLKPRVLCGVYVVAEATTHKDSCNYHALRNFSFRSPAFERPLCSQLWPRFSSCAEREYIEHLALEYGVFRKDSTR